MYGLSVSRALSVTMVLLLTPSPVRACINAVHLQRSAAVKLATEVDAALDRSDYNQVLSLLDTYALDEDSKSDDPQEGPFEPLIDTSNPKMRARLSRARGVAYLRTGRPRKAAAIFEALLKDDGQNPYLKTRLGEAHSLSKQPEERAEGKELLTGLAKSDLIPDAEGYLALARLTSKGPREQALGRCRQMSRDPELCQLGSKPAAAPSEPKPAPAAAAPATAPKPATPPAAPRPATTAAVTPAPSK